jgi:hypothetical protein
MKVTFLCSKSQDERVSSKKWLGRDGYTFAWAAATSSSCKIPSTASARSMNAIGLSWVLISSMNACSIIVGASRLAESLATRIDRPSGLLPMCGGRPHR